MTNDSDTPQQITVTALGRYQVLKRIGRGGMGDVWLCEDPRLQRQVAIKTLPTHNQSDREFSLRFEREAQAAAVLNHPHILRVHDYGEELLPSGQSITYIVMPYVVGGSLADRIAQQIATNSLLPEREIVAVLGQAAEAIDYAHEQGIVHRDIKPGNMLLRHDGWLLLADFGIARILASSEHLTQTGVGYGTPEYMAPEQAQGKAEPASDDYSLAVIAYQLFTGRVPFSADTGYATTIQHLTMAPPPPRQFNPAISPALEEALLRGLAKQPAGRPPSARAFVANLQHALTNASSEATYRPVASGQFPTQTGPTLPPYGSMPVLPTTDKAQTATEAVVDGTKEEHKRAVFSRRQVVIGGGAALVAAGGGLGAWAWMTGLNHRTRTGPLVGTTPSVQAGSSTPPDPDAPTLVLQGHFQPVTSLAWSPQQNMLASVADDRSILLWDVEQLQQQRASSATPKANKVVDVGVSMLLGWSPDGKMLAVANTGGDLLKNDSIAIYTNTLSGSAPGYETPLTVDTLSLTGIGWVQNTYVIAIASPITINSNQFDLWIWDITQPKQAAKHIAISGSLSAGFEGRPSSLVVSPDGSMVAFAQFDGVGLGQTSKVGNALQWKELPSFLKFKNLNSSQANAVTWSPSSNIVGALNNQAGSGTVIAYWSKQGSQWQSLLQFNAGMTLTTMAWCPVPTSQLVATGSKDGSVLIWHAGNSNIPVGTLTSGTIAGEVQTLAWSADGKWLAASYQDNYGSILVWKIQGRSF